MDVLSYLSELIQTRKAIGIAGLGTVFKKKQPGRYDAATHSFLPPSYTIGFTTEVKEDVQLPGYISKKRNVSADTASYFINEFSETIHGQLNDHQEASLGTLGKLIKTGDELRFEPADEISYGFDFYGLPAVKAGVEMPEPVITVHTNTDPLPEIIEEEPFNEEIVQETPDAEEPVTEVAADETTVLPVPEEHPTLESVITENEITEENPGDDIINNEELTQQARNETQLREEIEALNFYRSKSPYLKGTLPEQAPLPEVEESRAQVYPVAQPPAPEPIDIFLPEEEIKSSSVIIKILLGIVILLIMMTVAYFVKPDWFSTITGNAKIVAPKAAPASQVQPAAVPATTDSLATNDTLAGKTVTPVTGTVAQDTAAVVYEVIGASMHDQKEADNFIALMKKSGITAKVVTNMSGRRLKMSIATLKDEASAKQEVERLSKKLKIPGIYIYRNKQH